MFTVFFRKTYNFLQANHRFVSIVFASAVAVGFLWIFGVGSLQATWYSDTSGSDMWDYRQKITIDSGQIDSNLQDFPVYVDLSDLGSDFFNNVQADGADIRITTADGETELPREVVSVNTASSTGELHFKADNLSSTADTVFYIYYGSSSADNYAVGDTYGRNAVWSDYEAVWHLNEDPSGTAPQFTDATGNGWDGTAEGSMTGADLVDAEIGKGIDFDGVDDRINAGTTLFGLDIDYSLSAWAITDDSTNGLGGLTGRWDANNGVTILQRSGVLGALHDGEYGNLDDSENMSSTTFSKAKTTYDLDTGDRVMYVDGGQVNTDNQATPADEPGASDPWEIGAYGNNGQFFDGIVDEARLKNTVDSPDWESAEYTNQSNPNTFYTIDAQETQSSSNVPFGDNPDGDFADTDWDYRQKITIDSSQVDSNLTDFPVYVDLSDLGSQFFNNVTAGGGDIRVTAGDGTTELAREVVSVDTGSNTGELHFNADTISSSSDTDFYIYYGNEDANDYLPTETYGRNAVWSDYEAVWHLNEDPSDTAQFTDATGNGHDATANGAMTSGDLVSASLGNGLAFDGSDDYLDAGSGVLPTSVAGYTISAWAFEDSGATTAGIAGNWASHDGAALSTRENKWRILHESNNNPGSISTFAPIKLGHQVWTGTELILYVEGNENETVADSQSIGAGKTNFFIGQYNDNYFLGTIDEVRVRHDALSADWVSSENTNQNSPTTFYAVGSQEASSNVFGGNPDGDFADTDWNFREKITIESSEIDSTLTDFPVYIDLSDLSSQFFNNVQSDGGDIRVTNASGTELAREIVSIDTGAETGELHFKADSISSSTDTEFYIYYGNADVSNYADSDPYGREAVWNIGGNDTIVHHLETAPSGTVGEFIDSGAGGFNASDGTANSRYVTAAPSQISTPFGKGLNFDGSDVGLVTESTSISQSGSAASFSAWLRPNESGESSRSVVYGGPRSLGPSSALAGGFRLTDTNLIQAEFTVDSNDLDNIGYDISGSLTDWHHVVGTWDGSNIRIYVDGELRATQAHSGSDLDLIGDLAWGSSGSSAREYNGDMDETRAYLSQTLSADWISAEYTNQNSPHIFYTVGEGSNQYFTDFSEYQTSSQPSDWTRQHVQEADFLVENDAGATGDKVLNISGGSSDNTSHFLSWDELDDDSNRANYEILARVRFSDDPGRSFVTFGRNDGLSEGSQSAYTHSLYPQSDTTARSELGRWLNGSWSNFELETASSGYANNEWLMVRVRVNENNHSIKWWNGSQEEPASWTLEDTNSEIGEVLGHIGIGTWEPGSDMDVDFVGVGTGGAEAPAGPPQADSFGDDTSGDFADTDWEYREKITIQSSEVDSTLTDFPVYVDLSDLSSQFFNNVNSDGGDIRVTAGDGTTELAREVVSVDTGSNTGELHFKADSISASSDTDFYIYYGNSSASDYSPHETYGRNAVWSDYEAVWHLSEDPTGSAPQFTDVTGNGYNGTAVNMDASNIESSRVGSGVRFNGTDEEITLAQTLTIDRSEKSWQVWSNVDIDSQHTVLSDGSSDNYIELSYPEDRVDTGSQGHNDFLDTGTISPGNWDLFHITWPGNTSSNLYVNGSVGELGDSTGSNQIVGLDRIGRVSDFSFALDGVIDEMRVASFEASADWIVAEYTNQNSPNTFYTVGTSQTEDESAGVPNSATEIRSGEFRGGIEFR